MHCVLDVVYEGFASHEVEEVVCRSDVVCKRGGAVWYSGRGYRRLDRCSRPVDTSHSIIIMMLNNTI